MKPAAPKFLDVSAMSLSGLCMAHCLVVPAVALAVPAAGFWRQAEWFHPLCIVIAAPLTLAALVNHRNGRSAGSRTGLNIALLGLFLLTAAVMAGTGSAFEQPATVLGSTLLAGGHLMNWRQRRALTASSQRA